MLIHGSTVDNQPNQSIYIDKRYVVVSGGGPIIKKKRLLPKNYSETKQGISSQDEIRYRANSHMAYSPHSMYPVRCGD